jgi:hypothetical protein
MREPDGHIFEILVALSDAELGWVVEFVPEESVKTADMLVTRDGVKLYIECKRLSQRSVYAVEEEAHWRQQWRIAEDVVSSSRQWIWFNVAIHAEVKDLPPDWLATSFASFLPLREGEIRIADATATIRARLIDRGPLLADLAWSSLKASGSKLRHLLGQDWVPENAITSLAVMGKTTSQS